MLYMHAGGRLFGTRIPDGKDAAIYYAPDYEGLALDYCLDADKGCGLEAADYYCKLQQKKGAYAPDLGEAMDVQYVQGGGYGPRGSGPKISIQPKTGRLCDSTNPGQKCKTFYSITYVF